MSIADDLVATPGAADANAYITVAATDTLLEGRLEVAAWDDLTADQKARQLILASSHIDTHPLRGVPDSENLGPLHFPTDTTVDASDDLEIPSEVEEATAELALAMASLGGKATEYGQLQAAGVSSMSEGRLSVSFGGGQLSGGAKDLANSAWVATPQVRKLLKSETSQNQYEGWLGVTAKKDLR